MEVSENGAIGEHHFIDDIFQSSEWLLLSGAKKLTEAVAFRIANELASTINGNTLFICRDTRQGDVLPLRIDAGDDKYCFKWSPILLKNIDIFHANNSQELKRITALSHTLPTAPDLIIIESLSDIIDPLHSVSHSEYSFQHLLLMIKSFVEDAVRVINRQKLYDRFQSTRVRVIITDETIAPMHMGFFGHRSVSHGIVTELSAHSAQIDLLQHPQIKKQLCKIAVTEFVAC